MRLSEVVLLLQPHLSLYHGLKCCKYKHVKFQIPWGILMIKDKRTTETGSFHISKMAIWKTCIVILESVNTAHWEFNLTQKKPPEHPDT